MGCSSSIEGTKNVTVNSKSKDENISYDKFGVVCSLQERRHYEIVYSNCDECDVNGKMLSYSTHKRVKTVRKYT